MNETAFVCTAEYTFPWPVRIVRPHPSKAGETETQTFTGTFRMLDGDAGAELAALYSKERSVESLVAAEKEHIRRVLTGWTDGVVDSSGRALPFSPERLEELMKFLPFRRGVIDAYAEAQRAGPAEGN